MAGDWLKMRTRLAEEKAVMTICDLTGLDPFAVVGRLHAIWSWAGEHTTNGEVRDVTLKTVDRVTRCENFANAMIAAKWLEQDENGTIRFPRWKRHNAKAAKQRALASERQARKRAKSHAQKRDAQRDNSVTSHAPREEKRREEITTSTNVEVGAHAPRKRKVFSKPTLDEVTAYCAERGGVVDPAKWYSHYEANGWKVGKNPMVDWKAAVRTWEPEAKPAVPSRYVHPDSEEAKEWSPW
jgi:hypothetical protein